MITIPKPLEEDIILYCKVNNISDINSYIVKLINTAHTTNKYGSRPMVNKSAPIKQLEPIKEEIRETQEPIEDNTHTIQEESVKTQENAQKHNLYDE